MKKEIEKEVVDVLKNPNDIAFEDIQEEELSPLNQAVIEKEIAGVTNPDDWNVWKAGRRTESASSIDKKQNVDNNMKDENFYVDNEKIMDAPEQDIGNELEDDTNIDEENSRANEESEKAAFELPTATAKQAADTILGMSNNFLAVGGGFFVKIKKHKEFYDFDEIVELIDAQNDKNVKRIKLDKEDKGLLKPLLVAMLKKKAQKLTPEQQLIGAVISIVMKKAQVVMEVRAENDLLVERILDIVREEKGYSDTDLKDDSDTDILDTAYEEINGKPEPKKPEVPLKENEVIDPVIVEEEYDEEPRMENAIVEMAE